MVDLQVTKVSEGHYRIGLVHFEHYKRPNEVCAACAGTKKDPSNRRRKCRPCDGSGLLSAAQNCAIREGYTFSRMGNGRALADCIDSVLGVIGYNYTTTAGSYVYYVEDPNEELSK